MRAREYGRSFQHRSLENLRGFGHPCRMKCRLRNLRGQFAAAEMDVDQSGAGVAMAGEAGNLVQLPPGPSEVSEAKMAEGMGAQLWQASAAREGVHYLRPCPEAQRFAWITARFRYEEWSPCPGEGPPVCEVSGEQAASPLRNMGPPCLFVTWSFPLVPSADDAPDQCHRSRAGTTPRDGVRHRKPGLA